MRGFQKDDGIFFYTGKKRYKNRILGVVMSDVPIIPIVSERNLTDTGVKETEIHRADTISQAVEAILVEMREGFKSVRANLNLLRADTSSIRTEINADGSSFRTEIASLRNMIKYYSAVMIIVNVTAVVVTAFLT